LICCVLHQDLGFIDLDGGPGLAFLDPQHAIHAPPLGDPRAHQKQQNACMCSKKGKVVALPRKSTQRHGENVDSEPEQQQMEPEGAINEVLGSWGIVC
jgi:hypothetical protein